MAIDTQARAFLNAPVARQGRNPVFLLTVCDCPAKAGPPEHLGMQTAADRPIRKSSGYCGSNAKTALPLGIPAFNRSNVLIRTRMRTEASMHDERYSVCLVRPFMRAMRSNYRCWTQEDGRKRPESQQYGLGLVKPVLPMRRCLIPDRQPTAISPTYRLMG